MGTKTVQNVKVLQGIPASGGIATGEVCKIVNIRELSKMFENAILVTTTTSPEFLPAMMLAAAIVTDEGGILCHAAIVARELKKPCIVSTKTATKLFRDGQHVKVDAYKGIIEYTEARLTK